MKTDIAGSTPRFRALLAADRQSLLGEHREFLANHAADQGGQIIKSAGDGYWLEFPSVTAAAKSAIAMQEALILAQPNKGVDRLSMRVVIGLGDVAMLDGELDGDLLALMVRIEGITPADEIYLTSAARHALTPAEVQTAHVDEFALKGFTEMASVYRVEQRHRTRVIVNNYILIADLRGSKRVIRTEPIAIVERILDTLDTLNHRVARDFDGTIRFSFGDSYCLSFVAAARAIAAAERLSLDWEAASRDGRFSCAVNIALHRGNIFAFRSFLYGEAMAVAADVERASAQVLAAGEGGIFVTGAVRDDLLDSPWQGRLQPVSLKLRDAQVPVEVYRLMRA
jgi:class 3 adenylate cyclase